MSELSFQQVDVFTHVPLKGNPLAVVVDADGLSDETMASLANWTNLSETTFLLKPTDPAADYRARIFTPERELPFAGHPTLGSCQVWLNSGRTPKQAQIVQECGAGLIRIRRDDKRLAFAAPPLRRGGDVDAETLTRLANGLRIKPNAIKASQWVDNGPGWVAVMLESRAEVLALQPDYPALADLKPGVVAPWLATDGDDAQFEVRAFIPTRAAEDPVTGSLNAGLAQWLIGAGLAPNAYVAAQGTVLGRAGRVHVERDGSDIWIGGRTISCIEGKLQMPRGA
ncbi:PhzF family phenazine biosynthesis protein [Bradyrhizobium sp. LHD-71]|uniref:PhzF family phenazine biosynthesis protein n=1 Tax=Bradyrhizobium sp. LHD-71 TaxID=3072141 RepID=UPI00280E2B14|nr:PhzF family phenazine biosynthesis protein [Bradyrhizobium sp. LHD-71]MDQ8729801.1 PhzF family phenazine biosynthesis protein [Bradyrhizobium sp. LHD-71]